MSAFVPKYGTHVAVGQYYGEILIIVARKTQSSFFQRRRIKNETTVSFDPAAIAKAVEAGASVEIKLTAEDVRERKNNDEFDDFKIFYAGGISLSPLQINEIKSQSTPELAIKKAREVIDASKKIVDAEIIKIMKPATTYEDNLNNANLKNKMKFMPSNIIGAICEPYMKYLPQITGKKISWQFTIGNEFNDYLEIDSGEDQGARYVYPGETEQIIAILAPKPKFFNFRGRNDKRYEAGFSFKNGYLVSFIRKFSKTRHQLSQSSCGYDFDVNLARELVFKCVALIDQRTSGDQQDMFSSILYHISTVLSMVSLIPVDKLPIPPEVNDAKNTFIVEKLRMCENICKRKLCNDPFDPIVELKTYLNQIENYLLLHDKDFFKLNESVAEWCSFSHRKEQVPEKRHVLKLNVKICYENASFLPESRLIDTQDYHSDEPVALPSLRMSHPTRRPSSFDSRNNLFSVVQQHLEPMVEKRIERHRPEDIHNNANDNNI